MRIIILLAVFTLWSAAAFAQAQPVASNKGRVGVYPKRELTQERAALAQRDKIDAMLPPWVKPKLDIVSNAFLKRVLRDKKPLDLGKLADEEMARQFVDLSPEQSKVLNFYVLAGVIKLIPPHVMKDDLLKKKDSIAEMNEMDMLMLQQMMEKKGQLETIISNVMKAGFEGSQAAIQSLKAS